MKIGVISDVHGNVKALKAVLDKFDKIKVDKIICCGDIIGIGANPEETVQELIKRKEILFAVQGNHEKYLLYGLPKEVHDDKRKMSIDEIKNHEWTHSKLSEESKKFISELQISNMIQIENKKIYVIHYPIDKNGKYKKHIKNPTIQDNVEMFRENDADIYLYGHTHTVSVNNKNRKWYINPGSVGCPMKNNIAFAGVLDIDGDNIFFNQLEVRYHVEEVIEEINKIKFPFYEQVLKIFYGKKDL